MRARVPGARLLIVGPVDTVKEDALSPARARDFGLEDACVFTGMRQDMPELYGLMNVLALPSHREGFPRAPMEASAMGIPVVATDIRGCRETVLDGETGHLVPTSDPAALAGAIEGLLVDEARAQRFGARAEHLARERFDEQRVFAKVMATYERLLRSRGIAAPRAPLRAEEAPLRGVA